MRIRFLLLLLLAVPAYSQINVSFFAGVNPATNLIARDRSGFLDLYWGTGFNLSVSSEVFISRLIAIAPSVEYARYAFDNYTFQGVSIPEVRLKSATGEASSIWRIFAEAKFFPTSSKVIPWYFSTGLGYVIERIGTINATYTNLNGPEFTMAINYQGKNFFVHAVGLGIRWSAFSRLALDLNAQYFTNYNDRLNTAVKIGVVYSVIE